MKTLLLLPILFLSACSLILPQPHDPVMFGQLVEVKVAVGKLNCDDKNWKDIQSKVELLKVYTNLRNDPQADSVVKLEEALNKAHESKNKTFCQSILTVNKTRIDVIADAWRGR